MIATNVVCVSSLCERIAVELAHLNENTAQSGRAKSRRASQKDSSCWRRPREITAQVGGECPFKKVTERWRCLDAPLISRVRPTIPYRRSIFGVAAVVLGSRSPKVPEIRWLANCFYLPGQAARERDLHDGDLSVHLKLGMPRGPAPAIGPVRERASRSRDV
ncbi:hypothetical protein MPH_12878 [Macrophomina phaseolina MS6]|uniref:Uncharacterized protein n=1 Tax=Macrophomina phaseolina (strain MS6) TaxID=1126212 RepID=K2QJS8_MACPH|nr:hypothetical protein MPH_12878 [Macrophomina phaseolina MS6]